LSSICTGTAVSSWIKAEITLDGSVLVARGRRFLVIAISITASLAIYVAS
jgi:hypothetical protein